MQLNIKKLNTQQIILSTALFLIAGQVFSAPYTRCSEQQQIQLVQKFKLDKNHFNNPDAATFLSCINIDTEKNLQLLAISQPIVFQQIDDMEHDLNMYLIDSKQNKILQHYKDPNTYISDADHFDGIKLDINRFSTLNNINIIALETAHSHSGGFTYGHNNLTLFKIDPKQAIKAIFDGIGTHDYGSEGVGTCNGAISENTNSEVKRILVLSNTTTHGLQDITLKETKDQTITNYKTCKSIKKQYKQQQSIKFNGKEYKLQHQRLLGIDPF